MDERKYHAEYSKKWAKKHPDKMKAATERWLKAHPGRLKELTTKWREEHPDRMRELVSRWAKLNPERTLANRRNWMRAHPEKTKEYHTRWLLTHPDGQKRAKERYKSNHPERIKKQTADQHNKRKRLLPTSKVIGVALDGFVLHHMTPDIAVYIPEGLHKSIPHSLLRNRNMDRINFRANEWVVPTFGGFH